MKGSGHSSLFPLLLVLLTTLCAAWPWPGMLEKIDGSILKRQQSNSDETSTAASIQTSEASATQITDGPTRTNEGVSSILEASESEGSATATAGASESGKSRSTTRHATKTSAIDPRLPPGGVQMVTPGPLEGSQYYKVGDYVTFAWNYTSLSVTPTAVDVLATCVTNSQMYTISQNVTINGPTQVVLWDTGEYSRTGSVPFLVATYTLVIHDSSKDITAIPSAGYLGTYEQYQFGIYTPQLYVPLGEFKCASCNGALSEHERQALGVALISSVITILSFTWFAGGFGLLS